jgi:uncharacterized membrane protein
MKYELKKEIVNAIIALLPLGYLLFIWKELPDSVPLHWNYKGEIDNYGGKTTLLMIPFLLPILTYSLFLIIPNIDPKGKLNNMGNKLDHLKFLMTLFSSILALLILYSAKTGSVMKMNLIPVLVGGLLMVLGNYFKTIKPNYFIGIKTPWTLNNDNNWKLTHEYSGKVWIMGGLIIILSSLLLNAAWSTGVFIAITAVLVILPFWYSYQLFKKDKNGLVNQ